MRLLNGMPSNRENSLQGLRVLTASPVHPFSRKLTRELVPIENPEYLVSGDYGRIPGTAVDLDFYGQEWENLQDYDDGRNRRGFNDTGVGFG